LLAGGGVGVLVLAAVGMAVFAGGGKKRSASDQGRAQVRSVVETSKAAASAQPAAGEKPALPAAAVEPAKPKPAAEEKPQAVAETKSAAAEKIALPAEKPAQPEKPAPAPTPAAEEPKPAEKRVAAEKPAPAQHPAAQKPAAALKPAAERPVADKAKPSSEPALARPEKKPGPAAVSGAKPDTDKALWAAQAYQRGNAKLLGGAPTEAIAAFSEALKLNPKDAQSRRGLGLAYAQSGNAGQAVHHLKLYLKASPNAPDRALIQKRIDQLGGH
jgi:tetratricopeptide (TPR) repeat protein